ncbi:MAG: lysine--tRNA ligase [Simkaniaceae bacterium]|nr:lysine--tRNA ligase [Simkaniaceae bacterium]MCF7852355.1 lysine--tRNA ligase [Simkaniaceae bacterium]
MSEKSPEYHHFEEYQNRLSKLEDIKRYKVDPYPHRFESKSSCAHLTSEYTSETATSEGAERGESDLVFAAGRIILFRAMGKNAFAQIQDESGRIQLMFNRDHTKVEGLDSPEITPIKFIEKKLDLGDLIGIEGHVFKTHKGELTIYVKKLTLLAKSLLPLPDKHSGLVDKGVRYRKRWIDLICHQDVMETFKLRSTIVKMIRDYMDQHDFMEVETPVLQNIYGGAEARPFTTKLNALDQEMFLRISLEISLKKLLIGGYERIFEIGKVFRNEGIDRTHNPEFTMLEAYRAYWDYEDVMTFTEKLFEMIALKLFGTTKIVSRIEKDSQEHEIDLKTPWRRLTMKEAIQRYANIDVDALNEMQMQKILIEQTDLTEEDVKDKPRGLLIADLFGELVEKHLIQPHHIIDHPIETTPLCKLHRNPNLRDEQIVERFETFILGFEFCNAYSELNDPVIQRKLLEHQAQKRENGDDEASPMDEEFIEAICQGMPPAGGLGIGIDRLVMLFTGVHSIRDVVFFPLMKPEEN